MWLVIVFAIVGFALGYYLDVPFSLVGGKYLALIFLALLDSLTYALVRDLSSLSRNNAPVILRLIVGLVFGGFIIYFGEKSHIDLYLVALIPLAVGFALNLYKFLPK
jgi:small basic protein